MAKVLSVIASTGFQEIEYGNSKKALEEHGHLVVTASTVKVATDRQGNSQKADVLLKDVKTKNYDAILFVGGLGSHSYFDDPLAHRLAQEFFKVGKLTTAICAAPVILGRAGLLKGKKATCWPAQEQDLEDSGAIFTKQAVVSDGLLVTADGPKSAEAFGTLIAGRLK
jgi:protease I